MPGKTANRYRFAGAVRRGLSCALLALTALLGAGPTTSRVEAADLIRLTSGEWQPYVSRNAPHHGFASHIIERAFALVGVRVEWGFFPWARSMALAGRTGWNGTAIWIESEERHRDFLLSDPVVPSKWVFFHLKTSPVEWTSMEDLSSLRIGATAGYFYGERFQEAEMSGVLQVSRARSDEVNLKNLLNGRIDVFPGELMVTYAQIRDTFTWSEAIRITHSDTLIHVQPLHLLISKKSARSQELLERFNRGLRLLKKDGDYEEILNAGLAGKYNSRP